jgi:hypothetical protein
VHARRPHRAEPKSPGLPLPQCITIVIHLV